MLMDVLYRFGLIVLTTLINVFITFTVAGSVMLFCISQGMEKTPTLAITLVVAVAVTAYIRFYHLILFKIRDGEVKQ